MSTDIDRGFQINGKISRYTTAKTPREQNEVSGTCFVGLGMFDCFTPPINDPFSYNLPYYNNMNSLKGEVYCTQCCGQDPAEIDVWDLYCPVDTKWESRLTSITYIGAEFRMGRRKTLTDMEYVSCPMRSPECNYTDSGVTEDCDLNSPSPEYIVGYELHLNVKQYSENGQYWRGVDSCYAITTTRNTSLAIGEMFHERFVMHRSNEPRPLDLTGALVVGFGTIFVIFIALYFCRRQTCVVCQERLILFFDRCWLCRLFGGFIPDPELLKVLETKGEYLQNESERPERFPGSRKLVACIRGLVSCCCSSKSAKVDPDTDVESGSVSEKSKGFCGCCCSRKKKQKKKTARELKVVPLTVEPFVYYEAVHHPNIPLEILERKQKIEADHLYKEDLDIYGDLEHVPVKEGTDAHAAKLRIIAYREAKRKQHEKDAEKEKEKAFAELAKSKLISPQKRGVSEKSAAITSLARSKSSNALITDTRRNLGTNRKAKVVSEEKGTSDPLLLKPQQSFWTKATSKMGLGTSSQPLPDASLMTSGGVSTRGLGDIDVEETTTPQNNWKSALSGKFDAVATGVVNFSFPNRPKTPVEVEASKYAYLHKNEEHPET